MIGNNVVSAGIDSVFAAIEKVIEVIIHGITTVIFSNDVVTLLFFIFFINLIAILLMKKDKQYAETPNARRVRESTLLLVALVGGGIGEYYAMYKYKHKTLHKKFLYFVPFTIVLHAAVLSYFAIVGIMA